MATEPKKHPLIAVDTNVLIDLAQDEEAAWECLDALTTRRPTPRVIITPTVMEEIMCLALTGETAEKRSDANKAVRSLLKWGIHPLNLLPVGHGIVERIGDAIRRQGLIPEP